MNISGTLKATFEVPEGRIAELIATTLPETSWTISHFNEALGRAVATKKQTTQQYGIVWHYEYRANIGWEGDGSKYRVSCEVEDIENKATVDDCKQMAAEFFRRAKSNLERLKTNPLPRRTTYGSAVWADFNDLRTAGYIRPEQGMDQRSLVVGPAPEGELIAIPPEQAIMHSVVCGATGTGKTSSFIMPQAVKRLKCSAIFTEATDGKEPPALFTKTAAWRQEEGKQDVYYFNPADLTSNQLNLVSLIKKVEDSSRVADLIVNNTKQTIHAGGDPFWERAEKYILNALLIHAAGKKSNLADVRRLVQLGAKALEEELSTSYYQKARDEYSGFCRTGSETTRNNVFIGLLQRLKPWDYPIVEKITERTDFDISGLPERLFSFYLAVPADQEDLHPVAALVLNYLLDVVAQDDEESGIKLKHPIMLVLDEFTNFGRIPAFAKKMTLIRHRGVGVMLGFQSIKQLQVVYGKDEADWIMSQPGTRVFLRPRDYETADSISKMLGQRTHYERKVNSNGALIEQETGVPLMSPADVLALEEDKAILFTPSTRPLRIAKFHWSECDKASKLPTLRRRKLVVDQHLRKAGDSDSDSPITYTASNREDRDRVEPSHDERPPDF